jgi:chorismate mutase
MSSGVGKNIIAFYRQWIEQACKEGDDANTYGETATSDVVALMAIMERVNLGKSVAEAKFLDQPQAYIDTRGDREALLALLVKKDREAQVIELAANLAERYDLPAKHAVSVFNFMIDTTIDIEIDYLRMRISSAATTTQAS